MGKTHIRFSITVVVGLFLLVGVWGPSPAQAEVAKTTKNTRMMEHRGEKSRPLMRIPPGTTIKVLAKEGSWAKVRYKGRTGWVMRTTITSAGVARANGKKGKRPFVEGRDNKRNFSGSGPSDRVGADALGDDDNDGDDEVDEEELADDASADEPDEEPMVADRKSADRKSADRKSADRKSADRRAKKGSRASRSSDDDGNAVDLDGSEVVTVTASDGRLYRKPSDSSTVIQRLDQGAKLMLLKRSKGGQWLLVESADGDQGWIMASSIKASRGSDKGLMIRANARSGYTALSQDFESNGNLALANYVINASAASVAVGGDLHYRIGSSLVIAADAGYQGSFASPGIQYQNVDMAFKVHEVSGGGAVGVSVHQETGAAVYARVGYHYSFFGLDDYANPNVNVAQLPVETLQGGTLGGRVEIPRLADKLGMRLGADFLLPGTRTQTVGLRDGDPTNVFAAWAGTQLAYRLTSSFALEAGYRYTFARTQWVGVAERNTGATGAIRTDQTHLLSLGAGLAF